MLYLFILSHRSQYSLKSLIIQFFIFILSLLSLKAYQSGIKQRISLKILFNNKIRMCLTIKVDFKCNKAYDFNDVKNLYIDDLKWSHPPGQNIILLLRPIIFYKHIKSLRNQLSLWRL